ncbi:membrane AbrB-like protein [Clostridium punense]|uniref:Membrane AbrB-like protein n=1 Tax=Clostridium punense TaxID=1054297 RepID=A0ABS4K119_9CLOT|nr:MULTISPECIES: AbrB family transcriptional regulator [Clostridium]EQB88135.1 hypothetical protein M918_05750 [Clostridium sp. BL8]MBP2020961.1 membrane AbrB-like protein [Clostridium punense]
MEKIIYTLIVAAIGGYVGIKLKIPAGAMIGAMVFVAIYNIKTSQGYIPRDFKLVAQVVVGAMLGLNFNMESILALKKLILPSIVLVVGLTVFSLLLGILIHKITGLDLVTALFSSSPGGLTDMSLLSEAYGAQTHVVALMHLIRLTTVITVFPILIKFLKEHLMF